MHKSLLLLSIVAITTVFIVSGIYLAEVQKGTSAVYSELKNLCDEFVTGIEGDVENIKEVISDYTYSFSFSSNKLSEFVAGLQNRIEGQDFYIVLNSGDQVDAFGYYKLVPGSFFPLDERKEPWFLKAREFSENVYISCIYLERGKLYVDISFDIGNIEGVLRVTRIPLNSATKYLTKKERYGMVLTDKDFVVIASNDYQKGSKVPALEKVSEGLNKFDSGDTWLVKKLSISGQTLSTAFYVNKDIIESQKKKLRERYTLWALILIALEMLFYIFIIRRRYVITIEEKEESSKSIIVPIISLFVALGIIAVLILIFGENPLYGIREMFSYAFLSRAGLSETLNKAVPITIDAFGLAIAFYAGLWNIGMEGQFYLGAIGAVWISVFLIPGAPVWIYFIIIPLFSILMGAIWGLIPGFLKVRFGVNEILSTLMFNYVAIRIVDYLVYGPWKSSSVRNFPLSDPIPVKLPKIPGTDVHVGIFLLPVIALLLWFVFQKTTLGFKWKAIRLNNRAACYAGMNPRRFLLLAMVISGAFGGLSGAIHMMGAQYVLQSHFSPGYGYTAIIVAWLSGLNPCGIMISGPLLAGLFVGNARLELLMKFPVAVSSFFQGIVLLTLLVGGFLQRYHVKVIPRTGKVKQHV